MVKSQEKELGEKDQEKERGENVSIYKQSRYCVFRQGFQIDVFNIFKKVGDNLKTFTTELELINKNKI